MTVRPWMIRTVTTVPQEMWVVMFQTVLLMISGTYFQI